MQGEIISVGTELLLGDIVNTDAAYAARRLAELGISVFRQTVIGDNRERLHAALDQAFARADLVVLTGGLGPTGDDLTKEVTAEYFGAPLQLDEEVAAEIRCYMERAGYSANPGGRKQALVPLGAHVFRNENGTAPGLALRKGKKMAILLPGPPREMEPMFDRQIMPYLEQMMHETIRSRTVRLFGIGEAQVEQQLPAELLESSDPTLAPYAKDGEVELRITSRGASAASCEKAIQPVLERICAQFRPYVYGIDVPNLQTVLVAELRSQGLRIATAESLTGGLLSERLTQVPGSSAVFDLGVCSYANSMKERVLGVRPETLELHGAVSPQTAYEMAAGVRALAGSDIGVSTTGIAGPDGGTAEKPVGTVYVAVVTGAAARVLPLHLARDGSDLRRWIRHVTALHAFFAVLRLITKGDLLHGR